MVWGIELRKLRRPIITKVSDIKYILNLKVRIIKCALNQCYYLTVLFSSHINAISIGKIEKQEVRHKEEVNELNEKLEKTTKELNKALENLQEEHFAKLRDMYNIIVEKDQRIQDLESQVDDFKSTLQDVKSNLPDKSNYTLITINNALRANLKIREKEVKGLEKQCSTFQSIFNLLTFNKSSEEFESELSTKLEEARLNILDFEVYQAQHKIDFEKLENLIEASGILKVHLSP